MLPMFLAMSDQTIVASALPAIAGAGGIAVGMAIGYASARARQPLS